MTKLINKTVIKKTIYSTIALIMMLQVFMPIIPSFIVKAGYVQDDYTVTGTASPADGANVAPGDIITYTMQVKKTVNSGRAVARFYLPANTTFVSSTTLPATWGAITDNSAYLLQYFGDDTGANIMNIGDTYTWEVKVRVNSDAPTGSLVASVKTHWDPPNTSLIVTKKSFTHANVRPTLPTYDGVTATATVSPDSSKGVIQGEELEYTITLQNDATSKYASVIKANIPEGTSLVEASVLPDSGWGTAPTFQYPNPNDPMYTPKTDFAQYIALAPNESKVMKYKLKVDDTTTGDILSKITFDNGTTIAAFSNPVLTVTNNVASFNPGLMASGVARENDEFAYQTTIRNTGSTEITADYKIVIDKAASGTILKPDNYIYFQPGQATVSNSAGTIPLGQDYYAYFYDAFAKPDFGTKAREYAEQLYNGTYPSREGGPYTINAKLKVAAGDVLDQVTWVYAKPDGESMTIKPDVTVNEKKFTKPTFQSLTYDIVSDPIPSQTIYENGEITYKLRVKVAGDTSSPRVASNINLKAFIPAGTTYIAGSASAGTISDGTIVNKTKDDGLELNWTITNMPVTAASSDTYTEIIYKVRVNQGMAGGSITNSGSVADENTLNSITHNTIEPGSIVLPNLKLTIAVDGGTGAKKAFPDIDSIVGKGQSIRVVFSLENTGTTKLENVKLRIPVNYNAFKISSAGYCWDTTFVTEDNTVYNYGQLDAMNDADIEALGPLTILWNVGDIPAGAKTEISSPSSWSLSLNAVLKDTAKDKVEQKAYAYANR